MVLGNSPSGRHRASHHDHTVRLTRSASLIVSRNVFRAWATAMILNVLNDSILTITYENSKAAFSIPTSGIFVEPRQDCSFNVLHCSRQNLRSVQEKHLIDELTLLRSSLLLPSSSGMNQGCFSQDIRLELPQCEHKVSGWH